MRVRASKVTQVPVQRIEFLEHSNAGAELEKEEKNDVDMASLTG